MYETWSKIVLGRDAIVLVERNHEVLVQTARNSVKWIDKN